TQLSGAYTIYVLSDLINNINGASGTFPTDGWSATAATSFPSDGYHNNGLPACYAMGGGLRWTKEGTETAPSWKYGLDVDVTGNPAIVAQALWDSVEWYPECGDVWGWTDGSYGGGISLQAGKILRGEAIGLVLEPGTPLQAGQSVTVARTSDNQDAGSG